MRSAVTLESPPLQSGVYVLLRVFRCLTDLHGCKRPSHDYTFASIGSCIFSIALGTYTKMPLFLLLAGLHLSQELAERQVSYSFAYAYRLAKKINLTLQTCTAVVTCTSASSLNRNRKIEIYSVSMSLLYIPNPCTGCGYFTSPF
jgi:hypothetical protein